jgi:hypothetical protein
VDRQDWTVLSLWVHVPFIVAWIGLVMVDVVAMFAPGFERAQRARLLLWSRPFAVVAIVAIIVTGVWQTIENPFYPLSSYSDLNELKRRTLYGDLLFWKHVFVIATFVLTIATRFILAPRLRDDGGGAVVTGGGALAFIGGGENVLNLTRLGSLANLLACLGAILFATRMVWELH